ncbi:DsbC/DsbD-like thiol-disulfide interchange protein/cytochrome c biogenesis protein CcdA [Sphingomonas japonica]|uniref:DsbC/DsbD-like thiol-disulfide interchange protein/cytochrome c biogenesis protein CcdA n=2 Tax=Sphingomonas japonica TaxID=511662 RepID=A0ABX0U1G2_9SPHN|nr:protein-disulfide reductase DsbD domain-containing protein [Sphingomonas japonica]NIJ24404.1 DsbC/DsbD-like thiol-disulfide interchange protein/cytochrome c biogenesis protein CcdA [Sphingomonas japonica]
MRFSFVTFLCAFVTLVLASPAAAQVPGNTRHIAIELIAETDTPAAGSEVALAFASVPEPGWHGYWKNPGDAGIETTLDWTLPQGVTAGPLDYPVPQRLLIAGLMNYVYEGPFAQFATLKIPAGLAPGTRLPVRVKSDYLVCTDEICVPESAQLETVLTIGDGAIAPARRARFDRWRAALPKPLGSEATYQVAEGGFRLAVPFPAEAAAIDAYFFPASAGTVNFAAPQAVTRSGDLLLIETAASGAGGPPIDGVLSVGGGRGLSLRAVPGIVAAGPEHAAEIDWASALLALGGALLGGLILNIMPCVFPILSLKALSLARGGIDEDTARGEARAYTAGVILTCVALGAVLLALRAAGASAGWAFQLQDPRAILILLLLTTAIAFNLAGLFELSAPGAINRAAASGSRGGTGGAFATGALAAFIATPCTGPFMGVALGAALVLPWPLALGIFAGLGLGLALPFLLLGYVPALRRRLPRPGAWMDRFRKALSVPMFLTALALAWVLGRQAGVDGMTLGLGAALIVAVGLWWMGRRQARGAQRAWVPSAAAALLALGAVMLVEREPAAAAPMLAANAQPFTQAKLDQLRGEGRPIFAYFTADWCITCKVNEKSAIETADVAKAFADGEVQVLVGDWTDGDPALGRFIEQHNRAGVPLYLWYEPGEPGPRILPQLLTKAMLTDLPGR